MTNNTSFDPVSRPEHYANGKIECIDAMEEIFGWEAVMNFSLLNCFKYLWRRKNKDNEEQDIKKALWYFDKAKELMNDNYVDDEVASWTTTSTWTT